MGEALGEEGKVDESTTLLKLVNNLKDAKAELERPALGEEQQLISQVEKRMEVCKICASFLVVDDIEQRVQAHLNGKQHVGYAKIREMCESIRKRRQDEGLPEREISREWREDPRGGWREREKRRERERERSDRRGSDRSDRSDRDRGGRRRDRDRRRDRSRRRRSRSRSR